MRHVRIGPKAAVEVVGEPLEREVGDGHDLRARAIGEIAGSGWWITSARARLARRGSSTAAHHRSTEQVPGAAETSPRRRPPPAVDHFPQLDPVAAESCSHSFWM